MTKTPLSARIDYITKGDVTITHETITVSTMESKDVQVFNLKFGRIFQREELESIELATSLTSPNNEFRKQYMIVQDLFNCMKLLYYYGNPHHTFKKSFKKLKTFDISNYERFFTLTRELLVHCHLKSDRYINIRSSLYPIPKLPRFLTVENIIFLSKVSDPYPYFNKIGYYLQNDSTDKRLNNFPYLKTIQLLTSNEPKEANKGFQGLKYDGINSRQIESKFDHIKRSFDMNNIHFIKVEKPVYCYHLLFLASGFFLNDKCPKLGQILYCHKDTDVRAFLDEFTSNYQTSFSRCIIFHPEFLDESNRHILLGESKTRISSVSVKDNKKILIITSSDFTTEKDFVTTFDNDDITSCRLTSIKNLIQPELNNVSLEDSSMSRSKNQDEEVQFIDRENQHVHLHPDKRIRFKFAPELFDDVVEFWDELYGAVFFTYYVTKSDIVIYESRQFLATFEEPINGLIPDLNDFPFPTKNDKRLPFIDRIMSVPFPVINDDGSQNEDKKEKSVKNFLNAIVNDSQFEIELNDPLYVVIQKLYKKLFQIDNFDKKVSVHILRYLSDYIESFATSYLDCLWDDRSVVRRNRLLLLIMSGLYVYNLAPEDGFSIMCFNGMFDQSLKSEKTIDFYTTQKMKGLLFLQKPFDFKKSSSEKFRLNFIKNSEVDIISGEKVLVKNDVNIYDNFIRCLTNNVETHKKVQQIFNKDKNFDDGSISKINLSILNHSLSWPKFFKAVIISSRMSLEQPTILSGDTGCGKTSFISMFQRIINLIDNCKVNFYTNLNIHGDVGRKDIENHLKGSLSHHSNCNSFFFDEFNTSDALPFIEHIFINGYSENGRLFPCIFLGAINPLIKADEISKVFSKIGMEQKITTEKSETSLLNLKKTEEDINNYKYFVHKLNESEDLIINFNPMIIDPSTESKFLPEEEKMLIRQIIKFDETFTTTLFTCIEWIRKFMNENAVVSIRDVKSVFDFYDKYHALIDPNNSRNPELMKQSFQLAIISVFALRLPERLEISSQNQKIMDHLNELNIGLDDDSVIHVRRVFLEQIGNPNELMSLFDKFTFWYLRDTIMIDDKIWKFKSFLYHIVIMKLTIDLQKACFVIGPPGTSKSFALEQIAKDLHTFITTYMCSRGSSSEGLKSQFFDAIYVSYLNGKSKSVIVFEEMGLANINKRRPLKYIHFALDLGIEINSSHQYKKVASIGVSNYAMDLANMNRGTLIYTDIPNILELKINFSKKITIEKCGNIEFSKFDNILNRFLIKIENDKTQVHNEWIENFFKALWPNNSQPKTLALRSIYSLYQITKKAYFDKKITTDYFCRVAREIVNAKRLIKIGENGQINDDFKDLSISAFDFILRMFPDDIYLIPDELLEKPKEGQFKGKFNFEIDKIERTIKCTFETGETGTFNIKVDNLYILVDRIISRNSFKSLCLLTENYSALDNISSLLLDNLPETVSDLQFILDSDDSEKVIEKIKNMPPSKHPDVSFYFEEDFKERSSLSQTQKSINRFIQTYMSNPNEIPVIVGNNTMLDSLLDILNANKIDPSNKGTFNALISSDGFSWSYDIRTDFYIVLILQLDELIEKLGVIPLPLLDRLEIVYTDWSLLKYLSYFKMIQKSERFVLDFLNSGLTYRKYIDLVDERVCHYLNEQVLPDNKCPNRFINDNIDEYLHSSLVTLYKRFDNWKSKKEEMILNEDLNDYLMNTNWKEGMQCVIYTKSMLADKIYFENNFKVLDSKNLKETDFTFEIIDDESIADEDHFNQKIESNDNKPIVYIIKCSKFSEMHDQHLKKLIEKRKLKKIDENLIVPSFFIVYFHTEKEEIKIKSTMNWPVFWIEDISNNQLVLLSRNSAHLKFIYDNLTNYEFKIQNKPIMDHLIDRLFEFLLIPKSELTKIQNQFKLLIKSHYQDNCINLIDNLEEFQEDPNSTFSIQTQIFNLLMAQVKTKLLYFFNILVCHFLVHPTNFHFLSKKVYEFLRVNHHELALTITDYNTNMPSSDFQVILNDYVKAFLRNSPLMYFRNTFGYRFLEVVRKNSPFQKFIDLLKKSKYRNEYFQGLKLEDDSNLQHIFEHLNRRGFQINDHFSSQIFELFKNREFRECARQLLFSKGIQFDYKNYQDTLIYSYIGYIDNSNFNENIGQLISLLNSNNAENAISNRFERVFIYFDYILNLNIIDLIPKEAYENIDTFFPFRYPDKYKTKYFWNRYILSYIYSKKCHDKKIKESYKCVIDNTGKSRFFDKKENYDLNKEDQLRDFFCYLYGPFFFTAPQIVYLNDQVFNQFKGLLLHFSEAVDHIDNLQSKQVDLPLLESLIRSSCILGEEKISQSPEKPLFEKFTKDFRASGYINSMVDRIHSIVIQKRNLHENLPDYLWSTFLNDIKKSNLVKTLIEKGEFNGLIEAPSFNGLSLYELLHFYMTDIVTFTDIMTDKAGTFVQWFLQDTKGETLFNCQIYMLFRAVHDNVPDRIESQLIALLSLSAPWKRITHDNYIQYADSKYNYFPFEIIKMILSMPATFNRQALFNNDVREKVSLLKSATDGNGGYSLIDGKNLYIMNESFPTLSSVVYNYFAFNDTSLFPLLKSFMQLQRHRHFLEISHKLVKILFKLRKLFANNSRALFVILNCFSFVKNGKYELIQDLPFVALKFDKLFKIRQNRNIFTLNDFGGSCLNCYQQFEYVIKKYSLLHNDFVTFQKEKTVMPLFDFIPEMSLNSFNFNKFVASNVLMSFVNFSSVRELISPTELEKRLDLELQNNFFPFVTFELNKRYVFDDQPSIENPQKIDFLGMCKEDWLAVMAQPVNNYDDQFIEFLKVKENSSPGEDMSTIASLLLQIYYRDQCDEYLDDVIPRLDFGDLITVNLGFEVPRMILNAPIFEYLPEDFKNILRNLLH